MPGHRKLEQLGAIQQHNNIGCTESDGSLDARALPVSHHLRVTDRQNFDRITGQSKRSIQ